MDLIPKRGICGRKLTLEQRKVIWAPVTANLGMGWDSRRDTYRAPWLPWVLRRNHLPVDTAIKGSMQQ